MWKKNILITILIILFFILLILGYFKYSPKEVNSQKKIELIEKKNSELSETNIEGSNIIQDVSYSAKDTKGNEYFLKASEGTIDQNESNLIFLTSVKGLIKLKNYDLIEISSDFGKYNINNYDTIFSKNVIISYLDNQINGEYLDFSWEKNLMIISKNVKLKNDESSLAADVIEVNIKTKNIKIFMYEENKKVNINMLN